MFSPVCDCERDEAAIAFRLREADRVDLAIVDGDGDVVRTLFRSRSEPVGRLEASWDGRDDAGNVVPEGAYRPRVHLARQRRTIVLPNPIEVDVTAPVAELVSVDPTRLLAGRRRPFRQGDGALPDERAGERAPPRRRRAARPHPVRTGRGEARLVRDRRRQAAAARGARAAGRGRRPRRQRVAADRGDEGQDPLHRPRPRARPRAAARPVRYRRRHGRRVVPLALRRRHRHRRAGRSSSSARPAGRAGTRSSSRRTGAATAPRCSSVQAELAQIGGIVGRRRARDPPPRAGGPRRGWSASSAGPPGARPSRSRSRRAGAAP